MDFYKYGLPHTQFPNLTCYAKRFLVLFGSTWMCEYLFSRMQLVKSNKRNCLSDAHLEDELRLALTNIPADIEKLLDRFEIETLKNNKAIAFIKLRPKKNNNIEFVELNILHKHKYVSSVKIIYKGGNYWHVNFSPPDKTGLPKNAFNIPNDGSYKFRTIQ